MHYFSPQKEQHIFGQYFKHFEVLVNTNVVEIPFLLKYLIKRYFIHKCHQTKLYCQQYTYSTIWTFKQRAFNKFATCKCIQGCFTKQMRITKSSNIRRCVKQQAEYHRGHQMIRISCSSFNVAFQCNSCSQIASLVLAFLLLVKYDQVLLNMDMIRLQGSFA